MRLLNTKICSDPHKFSIHQATCTDLDLMFRSPQETSVQFVLSLISCTRTSSYAKVNEIKIFYYSRKPFHSPSVQLSQSYIAILPNNFQVIDHNSSSSSRQFQIKYLEFQLARVALNPISITDRRSDRFTYHQQ